MLNDNAKAWVVALRSSNFKQGKGYLRLGDNYCCLGIACELAATAGVIVKVAPGRFGDPWTYGNNSDATTLPNTVKIWLGLRNRIGGFHPSSVPTRLNGEGYGDLAEANDSGYTFSQIADIIESEPDLLFQ